jgi:hypothetical protein
LVGEAAASAVVSGRDDWVEALRFFEVFRIAVEVEGETAGRSMASVLDGVRGSLVDMFKSG